MTGHAMGAHAARTLNGGNAGGERVADAARKRVRAADPERDELAADLRRKYEAGQSVRALAAASGRSYGFVHRMLSESGATLRGTRRRGARQEARAPLADLAQQGVVESARRGKADVRLPDRVDAGAGLSDLVIEQRQ